MFEDMAPAAPPVWTWYRVYAGAMTLLYVGVVVLGLVFGVLAPESRNPSDPPPWFFALMFGCIGGPLAIAFGAAFFLPLRPWAWIYHLVLICIGLTSVCCMPAAIPLLIFWIKPETKQFFGRG